MEYFLRDIAHHLAWCDTAIAEAHHRMGRAAVTGGRTLALQVSAEHRIAISRALLLRLNAPEMPSPDA